MRGTTVSCSQVRDISALLATTTRREKGTGNAPTGSRLVKPRSIKIAKTAAGTESLQKDREAVTIPAPGVSDAQARVQQRHQRQNNQAGVVGAPLISVLKAAGRGSAFLSNRKLG